MTRPFPVAYSIPSPRAVSEEILSLYPIGRPTGCKMHMSGVNDVYLVQSGQGRYVFKVYRSGWRSQSEVLYELDLLKHLDRMGVPVTLPVARVDGEYLTEIPAPEGMRQSVLFTYAPGKPTTWPFHESEAESRLMGGALAAMHNAAESFTSPHARFQYDETEFLDRTLAAARPFLAHRDADWRYLVELTQRLRERLGELASRGMPWSVCHGDYHGGNLFISDDGTATVFDFDACGAGWSAYDLARWRTDTEGKPGRSWEAFLESYQERRPLSEAEVEAVPLFVILRMLHWMQIKSTFTASEAWDCWDMDFYLNDTLASLKEREAGSGPFTGRLKP
jgi:Ser/Thr protein kinase RdoA (MazF antagonist)